MRRSRIRAIANVPVRRRELSSTVNVADDIKLEISTNDELPVSTIQVENEHKPASENHFINPAKIIPVVDNYSKIYPETQGHNEQNILINNLQIRNNTPDKSILISSSAPNIKTTVHSEIPELQDVAENLIKSSSQISANSEPPLSKRYSPPLIPEDQQPSSNEEKKPSEFFEKPESPPVVNTSSQTCTKVEEPLPVVVNTPTQISTKIQSPPVEIKPTIERRLGRIKAVAKVPVRRKTAFPTQTPNSLPSTKPCDTVPEPETVKENSQINVNSVNKNSTETKTVTNLPTENVESTNYPKPPPSPCKLLNRPRFRSAPKLCLRRNSTSASESEDDSRRTFISRIRNDSVSSNISTSKEPSTPVGDTPTVLSAQKSTTNVPIKKKVRRSEFARKMAEAKRDFVTKFGTNTPDRQRLTMMDLIFYNPVGNPMPPRKVKPVQEKVDEPVTDVTVEEDVDDPDDDSMPVPQVKVGENGEIILDEQSLVIETTDMKRGRELTTTTINYDDLDTGYGIYKRAKRTKDWSMAETKQFYRVLQMIGTDFSMMLSYFKNRTRRDLKLKFKKEERTNRSLIDKVLRNPRTFDVDELQRLLEKDEEIAKQQELEKNKAKEQKVTAKRNRQSSGKRIRYKTGSFFARQIFKDKREMFSLIDSENAEQVDENSKEIDPLDTAVDNTHNFETSKNIEQQRKSPSKTGSLRVRKLEEIKTKYTGTKQQSNSKRGKSDSESDSNDFDPPSKRIMLIDAAEEEDDDDIIRQQLQNMFKNPTKSGRKIKSRLSILPDDIDANGDDDDDTPTMFELKITNTHDSCSVLVKTHRNAETPAVCEGTTIVEDCLDFGGDFILDAAQNKTIAHDDDSIVNEIERELRNNDVSSNFVDVSDMIPEETIESSEQLVNILQSPVANTLVTLVDRTKDVGSVELNPANNDPEPSALIIRVIESPVTGKRTKQAFAVGDTETPVELTEEQFMLLESYLGTSDSIVMDLPVVTSCTI